MRINTFRNLHSYKNKPLVAVVAEVVEEAEVSRYKQKFHRMK